MSSEQLVNAYVEGQITRRTLIRRLTALGVSFGTAVSYAHVLAPQASARRAPKGVEGEYCVPSSEYPEVHLKIKSDDIKKVIDEGVVRARVRAADPGDYRVKIRTRHGYRKLGHADVHFDAPGKQVVSVPVEVDRLVGRDHVGIYAYVVWLAGELCDHNVFVSYDFAKLE